VADSYRTDTYTVGVQTSSEAGAPPVRRMFPQPGAAAHADVQAVVEPVADGAALFPLGVDGTAPGVVLVRKAPEGARAAGVAK
jgi:hypothetical protein